MYEFTVLNDIFNFWRYKMTTDEKALELHEKWNGKITTEAKCHVKTREDLSLAYTPVSYTHLRAHETRHDLVCRLLLEKKKKK